MIEKFADFEKSAYLDKTGVFTFTITDAELTNTKKGDPMWKFTCDSEAGQTTLYHAILPTTKWSFNKLIAACLNLTDEQKKTFSSIRSLMGKWTRKVTRKKLNLREMTVHSIRVSKRESLTRLSSMPPQEVLLDLMTVICRSNANGELNCSPIFIESRV